MKKIRENYEWTEIGLSCSTKINNTELQKKSIYKYVGKSLNS